MSQTIATVHNGHVKVPSHWPDGTEVKLYKIDQATDDEMSQEEIERVIQARQVQLDQGYDQQADEELRSIINQRRNTANDDRMTPEEIKRVLQARDEYFKQEFDQTAYREIQKALDEIRSQDKATAFKFLDHFGHDQ